MKYHVVEERSINDGKKEVWYLIEPKNKIMKFLVKIPPLNMEFFCPRLDKEKALREAHLKSIGKWNKLISRKKG